MREVVVIYHFEPEGYWAESPDVAGFSAAGETLAEVREMAFEGLRFHVGDDVALIEKFPESVSVISVTSGAVAGPVFGGVVIGQSVNQAAVTSARWTPAPTKQLVKLESRVAHAGAS